MRMTHIGITSPKSLEMKKLLILRGSLLVQLLGLRLPCCACLWTLALWIEDKLGEKETISMGAGRGWVPSSSNYEIRTVMVAPGGEALGGVMGTCRHIIQTEGFFSLYKGLGPSLVAMAPSGAVFYGVYDMLKAAYLHSPEGKKRIDNMKCQGEELNALDQLELGPIRTLIYGAVAGACSEAATYPFEVVRRQLQLQVRETKLSAVATCIKIVEQGGVPALYAGLIPSLLQVLPSAAISYFVYEFMKIVLEVES